MTNALNQSNFTFILLTTCCSNCPLAPTSFTGISPNRFRLSTSSSLCFRPCDENVTSTTPSGLLSVFKSTISSTSSGVCDFRSFDEMGTPPGVLELGTLSKVSDGTTSRSSLLAVIKRFDTIR